MKKALFLFLSLPLATSAVAAEHRSKLSLGVEGGTAMSGLGSAYDAGRISGGRIQYDINARWAAAARFQSRTFKRKKDQTQRAVIQPVTAEGRYNFREPGFWTPYGFLDLGMSHNRRTVQSISKSGTKPAVGLGAGIEVNFLPINSLSVEVAHRRFAGASDGGHQVTENGFTLSLNFYIPDDWVPIRPAKPLNIPDMDDPRFKPAVPLADAERRQAQEELDKVQQDIRDHKAPPIHFETGQTVLLQPSYETLDIVGTILRRYPALSVKVTGHADEVGSEEDNVILSLARAEVVRAYLIQNFGLPAEKITADGLGQSKPIADNTTDEGRFLNRRVEFSIQLR